MIPRRQPQLCEFFVELRERFFPTNVANMITVAGPRATRERVKPVRSKKAKTRSKKRRRA